MEKLLQVNNLKVKVKKSHAELVKGISFDVYRNQILGVIGESGSGKSMTCRSILGLLDNKTFSVQGQALFEGKDLFSLSANKMQILQGTKLSIIMQNPMTAFDPVCKIGQQLIETIRAHRRIGKKEAYSEIASKLESLELTDAKRIMNSYPFELSGGMLQRIMIALALIVSPELIIADEATTALDVCTQAIILDEFRKIRKLGISMIVVTHDFGVLANLADHVIVLKNGQIVESGTVYQIFENPQHDYTKELLNARCLKKESFYA